jgi:UDP-N-acetylglucosamine transferase subunit ALG13
VILVTTGTTMPFDELLAEMDRLAGTGILGEPVLCQSGQSTYRMQHAEQFMAAPTLADLIEQASLVVTHGGATVVQLLIARKPFVAIPNPRGAGDHQTGFLREIATMADISWSPTVTDLETLITTRRTKGPATIHTGIPRATTLIRELLP